MTPRETAQKAAEAMDARFGLMVGSGGQFLQFNSSEPLRAVSGDYFSAETSATTQRFGEIDVECEWIADGKTHVTLTSDMPDAQSKIVSAELRRALTAPTSQSAASGPKE